jgi:preprotein translocase subunit SecF
VLLVGLLSGTYSSIFNAVPLLVVWETRKLSGRTSKATA